MTGRGPPPRGTNGFAELGAQDRGPGRTAHSWARGEGPALGG